MKARIRKIGAWWYGEVYGEFKNILFNTNRTGWQIVTNNCYTKIGAKSSLKRWINENCPIEFEI